MEKTFEHSCAINCLLSQSYNDGIQKIVGGEKTIPFDFQLPQNILEKREASWNNLFKKYSTMTSEVTINMRTLEAEIENVPIRVEEPIEPRMPMRKSMSMVQYWVDTGNQPYTENFNDKTHSDSGSSLAEEENLELHEAVLSQIGNTNLNHTGNTNLNVEKQSEVVGISNGNLTRIASSSSSSVDTAAYILANNNTTKKAETLAILEGSKFANSKENICNIVNSVIKDSVQKKSDLNARQFREHKNKGKSSSQNFNGDSGLQSIAVSNSDESLFNSKYITGLGQRKKLYINRESPAEFTPASEAASSHGVPRFSLKQCDHPAFQTPKVSRPSYVIRRHRQRFRKKKSPHILSLISFSKNNKNNSTIKMNNTTPTIIFDKSLTTHNKGETKVNFDELKNNKNRADKNLDIKTSNCSYSKSNMVQQTLDRRKNSEMKKYTDCNNRFNLKTVQVILQKLPDTCRSPKTDVSKITNSVHESPNQKKESRLLSNSVNESNQVNTDFSDDESSNELFLKSIEYQKGYTQNEPSIKQATIQNNEKNNSKTNIEVLPSKRKKNNGETSIKDTNLIVDKQLASNLEKVKAIKRTNSNVLVTVQMKSSFTRIDENKNKILCDKSIKYVPVLSSDESDAIIHVSNKKLKKKSLKRKTTNNEKLENNSKYETKTSLNSNSKKTNLKSKSTAYESSESDKGNSSISKVNLQINTASAYNEQMTPVKEKFNDANITKIKNKNLTVSFNANKNSQCSINAVPNKNDQAEVESKNEKEIISNKLMTKSLVVKNSQLLNKVNDKVNDLNDNLVKKKKNDKTPSDKFLNEKRIDVTSELTDDHKNEELINDKKRILDKDSQDLQERNLKRKARGKSNKRSKSKENKSKNNLKRKTDEILILSDDECFIPLKVKA